MAKNPRFIDMTSQRFGDLVCLRKHGNLPRGGVIWWCRCDCGKEYPVSAGNLRGGKVASCGHRGLETFRAATRTHGQSGTPLYKVWKAMRSRCERATDANFKNYGGRGIRVCKAWGHFEPFAEWARSAGYRAGVSIERINNNKGYNPTNCRWATLAEQAINKRNVPLSPDGRPWWHIAKANGITMPAYRTRVFDGWPLDQAATWPMFKKRPK